MVAEKASKTGFIRTGILGRWFPGPLVRPTTRSDRCVVQADEQTPDASLPFRFDRFVSDTADITGHVAFALFVKDRASAADLRAALKAAAETVTDETIAITYRAAAKRLVDLHDNQQCEIHVEQDIRDSGLYLLIKSLFVEKQSIIIDRLDEYSRRQDLWRQVIVSALSTASVGSIAYVIVKTAGLF